MNLIYSLLSSNLLGECNLIEHEVSLVSVDRSHEFGVCSCKVHPPTFDDVRNYNKLIDSDDGSFWTCSPWSSRERGFPRSMAIVHDNGSIDISTCIDSQHIRIVCVLDSDVLVLKKDRDE